jgi:hypothetical protein
MMRNELDEKVGQVTQRVIAHLGPYPSVDFASRYLPQNIRDPKRRGGSANAIAKTTA